MRLAIATATALLFAASGVGHAADDATPVVANAPKDATTQLPRTVRPVHYDVSVVPDAKNLSFDGRVAIALDVLEPTKSIVLNAVDMTFANASLAGAGRESLQPNVWTDADTQTATFTFEQPLAPGRYTLTTDYTGRIGTQANGLFAIDYDTEAGRERALFTQFEAADARRFVPSWDEPNDKATFALTATVPSDRMAVSNMPIAASQDLGDGTKKVTFATSPKMSTYLLFFALGDFERATRKVGDTEVGVVTQAGKTEQARFALDSSVAVLEEYNAWFGTPYPLPKLDNVASPGGSQFFTAMENWGAIFTFEYALLLDPSFSTHADRQAVFAVAAHEIAHQWFGNLVTMGWWDDLWLNESFATWLGGRTTAKLHPEWNTELDTVEQREGAIARDAVASTHPVVQEIATIEQIGQAFDAISYSKGAAVIRMLEGFVGEDAWRKGVRSYIAAHQYGNTRSDDLWRAIQQAADVPVLDIAHDFTLQPGVPLIRVESAECRDGTTTVKLVQGEFTKDRPDKVPLNWRVPVIARAGGEAARTVVSGEAQLSVPGCGALVVNAGQSGYYRTLYAQPQFEALRAAFATLAPIDQLGVLADAWSLGMVGGRPLTDVLDLAQTAPADADARLWQNIAGYFATLDALYRDDPRRRADFRRFATRTLAPVFARLGWAERPDEPAPAKILRTTLIEVLGALGDASVVKEAERRWSAGASDPEALPPALRKSVLRVVALHADASTWGKLRAAARAEKTPLVKDQYYALLASAEDRKLAQRALDLALEDEPGATNTARMIAQVAVRHPVLAFDFATKHREQVDARLDATARSRWYPNLAFNSLDRATIAALNAFAERHIAATSRQATDTVVANIRYRIQVRDERLPALDAWLARNGARGRR